MWGPIPTGGGIKSREEQPGGEVPSGEEGPKVPEGLGGTPIKHEPVFHLGKGLKSTPPRAPKTPSQNSPQNKVQILLSQVTFLQV